MCSFLFTFHMYPLSGSSFCTHVFFLNVCSFLTFLFFAHVFLLVQKFLWHMRSTQTCVIFACVLILHSVLFAHVFISHSVLFARVFFSTCFIFAHVICLHMGSLAHLLVVHEFFDPCFFLYIGSFCALHKRSFCTCVLCAHVFFMHMCSFWTSVLCAHVFFTKGSKKVVKYKWDTWRLTSTAKLIHNRR